MVIMMKLFRKIILVSVFFGAVSLFSQVWIPPGAATKPKTEFFTYDFGLNKFDGDYFLYLAPSLNFNLFSEVGMSVTLPMNILLKDYDPKYENSKAGMLRPQDYDEKSDYLKTINYIWYGTYGRYEPGKMTWSFFAGKIYDGYVGHGTIVYRYINNVNLENYKAGIQADINTDFFGAQAFSNSVYDRQVNAGRFYIRPFAIFFKLIDVERGGALNLFQATGKVIDEAGRRKVVDEVAGDTMNRYISIEQDPETGEKKEIMKEIPEDEREEIREEKDKLKKPLFKSDAWYNRFAMGYTNAFDSHAPLRLDLDTTAAVTYDDRNYPATEETERITIEGYDVEYKIFSNKYMELTPYYDINRIKGLDNSVGHHKGVLFKFGSKKWNITYRPEHRTMSSNYLPSYFDSFYEIERYQFDLTASVPHPKWHMMKNLEVGGPEISGYYQSVILNMYSWVVQLDYEDYTGSDNSKVFLGVYLPVGSMFLISAYYNKKNFERQSEAFVLDDRSQGAVEVGIKLGGLMIRLQNNRTWEFDANTNKYVGVDEQKILFSGGASF